MRQDGAQVFQVTHGSQDARDPAWSPDGLFLVFVRGDDLWLTTVIGFPTWRLTNTPGVAESMPAWSPLGVRIAYVVTPAVRDAQIWTIRVDGSGAQNLTTVTEPAGMVNDTGPNYTPDGQRISFASNRLNTSTADGPTAWTMRTDGTDPIRLTTSGFHDGVAGIAVSPDGSRFAGYACSSFDCFIPIYTHPTDGSPAVRVGGVAEPFGDGHVMFRTGSPCAELGRAGRGAPAPTRPARSGSGRTWHWPPAEEYCRRSTAAHWRRRHDSWSHAEVRAAPALAALTTLGATAPAHAAFPGSPGRIAFVATSSAAEAGGSPGVVHRRGDVDLNPDGTGFLRLTTNDPCVERHRAGVVSERPADRFASNRSGTLPDLHHAPGRQPGAPGDPRHPAGARPRVVPRRPVPRVLPRRRPVDHHHRRLPDVAADPHARRRGVDARPGRRRACGSPTSCRRAIARGRRSGRSASTGATPQPDRASAAAGRRPTTREPTHRRTAGTSSSPAGAAIRTCRASGPACGPCGRTATDARGSCPAVPSRRASASIAVVPDGSRVRGHTCSSFQCFLVGVHACRGRICRPRRSSGHRRVHRRGAAAVPRLAAAALRSHAARGSGRRSRPARRGAVGLADRGRAHLAAGSHRDRGLRGGLRRRGRHRARERTRRRGGQPHRGGRPGAGAGVRRRRADAPARRPRLPGDARASSTATTTCTSGPPAGWRRRRRSSSGSSRCIPCGRGSTPRSRTPRRGPASPRSRSPAARPPRTTTTSSRAAAATCSASRSRPRATSGCASTPAAAPWTSALAGRAAAGRDRRGPRRHPGGAEEAIDRWHDASPGAMLRVASRPARRSPSPAS